MSENDSNERFAFGTYETDSPQFNITCQCPVSTALSAAEMAKIQERNREIIDIYDEICRDWYPKNYSGKTSKGHISEEKAIDAWEEVLIRLRKKNTHHAYELAYDVAYELNWLDEMDEYFQIGYL